MQIMVIEVRLLVYNDNINTAINSNPMAVDTLKSIVIIYLLTQFTYACFPQ